MKVFAADPGLHGGCSIYSDGVLIAAIKTPIVSEFFIKNGKKKSRNNMDLAAICDFIELHKPTHGVLEKVAARSGQGVTSMFRFGQGLGEYRGILAALRVKFIMPTPQAWKKVYTLSSDKEASLNLARELWPDFAMSHFKYKNCDGVAEAALMAKYGFDHPELFE